MSQSQPRVGGVIEKSSCTLALRVLTLSSPCQKQPRRQQERRGLLGTPAAGTPSNVRPCGASPAGRGGGQARSVADCQSEQRIQTSTRSIPIHLDIGNTYAFYFKKKKYFVRMHQDSSFESEQVLGWTRQARRPRASAPGSRRVRALGYYSS